MDEKISAASDECIVWYCQVLAANLILGTMQYVLYRDISGLTVRDSKILVSSLL